MRGDQRGIDHGRGHEHVGSGRGEDRRDAVGLRAGVVGAGLVEHEWHEAPGEAQPVAVEQRAQRDGVERQVADRAELRGAQPQ